MEQQMPAYWAASHVPEGSIFGGAIVFASAVLYLRRRLGRDNRDGAIERVEVSYVVGMKKLLDERTVELVLMTEERNRLATEVGGLRERVQYQADRIETMEKDHRHDRSRIRALERRLNISFDDED